MKFITYAKNLSELKKLYELKIENLEVIVSTRALGRYSEQSVSELLEIININQTYKLKLVLEWDVLKQDKLFHSCIEVIKSLPLHEFHAIRVQDPGAVRYIKENYTWLNIQLILENGNHNFQGLMRWKEYLGEQLERLVLSNELSKEHLATYARELSVGIEVLTYGRILLFYSPRSLLSPLEKEKIQNQAMKNIEAFATSQESPHSGFPLIENQHGTFMFNVKDLYLMEHLDEMRALNIAAVRVDLRFDDSFTHIDLLSQLYKGEVSHEEIIHVKKGHMRPAIKGFYNINKTDVLFTKLKNKRIQRQDENYIGEIVDVERDEQLACAIKSKTLKLKIGDEITIITPEGKVKTLTLSRLHDSLRNDVNNVGMNEIVLFPYLRGVVPKSQVYLKNV